MIPKSADNFYLILRQEYLVIIMMGYIIIQALHLNLEEKFPILLETFGVMQY